MDHYAALEIARTASAADVRAAYKRLSRAWHPDKRQGEEGVEERFRAISEAHTVLSDRAARAEYDRTLVVGSAAAGRDTTRPVDATGVFNDMFSRPRQGAMRPPAEGQPARKRKATTQTMTCTLEELATGTHKRYTDRAGRRHVVPVPAGTRGGTVLGLQMGASRVRVVEAPHPTFRRDGNDLHTTVRLHLRSALLAGTAFRAPLLGGSTIELQTPSVVGPHTAMAVPGRGMPIKGAGGAGRRRGAMYVHFDVVFPATLSRAQQTALAQIMPKPPQGTDSTVRHQ